MAPWFTSFRLMSPNTLYKTNENVFRLSPNHGAYLQMGLPLLTLDSKGRQYIPTTYILSTIGSNAFPKMQWVTGPWLAWSTWWPKISLPSNTQISTSERSCSEAPHLGKSRLTPEANELWPIWNYSTGTKFTAQQSFLIFPGCLDSFFLYCFKFKFDFLMLLHHLYISS